MNGAPAPDPGSAAPGSEHGVVAREAGPPAVGEVLALLSVPVLVAVAEARFSPAAVWVSAATVCGVLAAFAQFLPT